MGIRKFRYIDVQDGNVTFEVNGDWKEFQAATETDPAEGGHFCEYFIWYQGEDWTERLNEKLAASLVIQAEEKLRDIK